MMFRTTFALIACFLSSTAFSEQNNSQQIDQDTWSIISQSVKDADIHAMGQTYHPDAVVVSAKGTTPISVALASWGEGMQQAKASGSSATVAFRFSSRQDDENSAFETGIFKYIATDAEGNESQLFMGFETLLVKKDKRWQFIMERQLNQTDEASWDALQN
jgi:ketosteroid isomerase-like protein